MKKKIFMLATVATLALAMTACGKAQESNPSVPTTVPTKEVEVTEAPIVEPTKEAEVPIEPTATLAPTNTPLPTATPEPTATPVPTATPEPTAEPTQEPVVNPCLNGHTTPNECYSNSCSCSICWKKLAILNKYTGDIIWYHNCTGVPEEPYLIPLPKASGTTAKVTSVVHDFDEYNSQVVTITYEDGTEELHNLYKNEGNTTNIAYVVYYPNGDYADGYYTTDEMPDKNVEVGTAPFAK